MSTLDFYKVNCDTIVGMKYYSSKNKGFSLIELLVVIAIIGILTAIIITSISNSRSKAKDAKRISDIAQIQLALEQYYDKNKSYPADLNTLTTSGFISVIPTPPESGSYNYYRSTNTLDYIVRTVLENYSDVLKDGLYINSTIPSGYSVSISCRNNASFKEYCMGPK